MTHEHEDEPYISPRQSADEAAREEAEREELRRRALETAADILVGLHNRAAQYGFDDIEVWIETVIDELAGEAAHDAAHQTMLALAAKRPARLSFADLVDPRRMVMK